MIVKTYLRYISAGRLSRRKKRRASTPEWDIHSCPLNENIWEYLHDDKQSHNFACTKGKTAKNYSKQLQYKRRGSGKNFLKLLIFFLSTLGFIMSMDYSTSVDAGCCHRMSHLARELSRAQQALRATMRLRKTLMLTSQTSIPEFSVMQRGYVDGARATKGSDTTEWGGRLALWGVVPLWRASPPPDTVLALRTPTPSDCWSFSGSYGEVIIELSRKAGLSYIGVEHVRPDTTRSAPKNFVVYGILDNNTRMETARGTYKYSKPAKQYFPLSYGNFPLKSVAFRVLSNQGNLKYTCLYRVHLYGEDIGPRKVIF